MSKNLKTKVLLSVLAIGLSYGMQAAEAGLPHGVLSENHNVYIADSINSSFIFNTTEEDIKIVTPFYYDPAYTKGKGYEKNAINNQITMNGSKVDNIYGAYTASGTTESNKANITGGVIGYIGAAAYSGTGLQKSNELVAKNCEAVSLYGARGGGKLLYNTATVSCSDSSITYDKVAGARATDKGVANFNNAYFNSGKVFYFAGALTDKSAADGNVATVNGGTISHAHGAFSVDGAVTISNNYLIIHGGDVNLATGGESHGGLVKNNVIIMDGGKASNLYGATTVNKGSATANIVQIRNTGKAVTVTGDVYGALVDNGAAKANKVEIEINCGSLQNVYGGKSYAGNVTNNEAYVLSNKVNSVYGAYTGGKGVASGNTAHVGMGSVTDAVIGAQTEFGAAKNNKAYYINCSGTANEVIGGLSTNGGAVSGNLAYVDAANCVVVNGGMSSGNGKVTSNQVEIGYSEVSTVMGATTENGAASKNSVVLRDETHITSYVYGASSVNGNATSNKVTLNNKSYVDSVCVGGMSTYGNSSKNSIVVETSGDNSGQYMGGASYLGKATSNTVSYSGSKAAAVVGGYSAGGLVSLNNATLINGKVTDMGGGGSNYSNVTKNKVTVSGGEARFVFGGYSGAEAEAASVSSNTVKITGGNFTTLTTDTAMDALKGRPGIYGGAVNMGTATKNVVNFYGGVAGEVYGGMAKEGNVTYNTVNLKLDGAQACYKSKDDYVYGGYTLKGNTVGNTVNMVAGTARNIAGGWSLGGNATSNNVKISGTAKVVKYYYSGQEAAGCNIYGGFATETASKNSVLIKDAETHNATVTGGSGFVDSLSNKVTITNAEASKVYGGVALGNASKNSVTINGNSTIHGDVFGGNAIGETSSNTVTISGHTEVNGSVYGGSAKGNYNKVILSGDAHVQKNVVVCGAEGGIGNSVTMSGRASVGGTVSGFQKQKGVPKDQQIISGGSLILDGWSGSVGAVEGLESISFKNITAKPGTSLMVLAKGEDSDLSGTTITVGNSMLGSSVKGVSVMSAEDGKLDVSGAKLEDGSAQTVGTTGIMKLAANDNAITADYVAGGVNPQTKALAESRTAAAAFVNQGTEIVEHGIGQVAANGNGTKTFAAMFGNASRYNTGSHVKVNGWSGIVGIGNTVNNGKLTYGAFFENGTGNYRTFASAMGMPICGYGEATYNGGGLLVKNKSSKGVYVEGAVRAGRLQNKLNDAVLGGNGLKGYDVSTSYYGAHIGVGKEIKLSEHTALDLYAKYLYTHHGSKSYRIDGDEFRFDSLNSQRTRLGFRINSKLNDKAKLYYGLVWDYELDGKADNKVQGYSLHTPSLKGSTVFLDLGAEYKLNDKWSLDINAKGYAGERRGVTGSAQVSYSF